MRKIFLGLIFLFLNFKIVSASEQNIYCYNPGFGPTAIGLFNMPNVFVKDKIDIKNETNKCLSDGWAPQPGKNPVEITKDIYLKLKNINDSFFKINLNAASDFKTPSGSFDRKKYDEFVADWRSTMTNSFNQSKDEKNSSANLIEVEVILKKYVSVSKINNNTSLSNKKKESEDPRFIKKCEGNLISSGYKKGTKEFENCIIKEEKLAALEFQKQQIISEEKNKKFQQQKDFDQAKIKEEQIKVSKMKPEDRHAYTCTEKFGFRKGSDKFRDCIFELYKAETELEKLELQKQIAKANADAAKASAEAARASTERQERLSLAQTEAAKMQAYALEQQAIATKTTNNLILLETGLRMLSPAPAPPRTATTCSFNGRFMNCF